MSFLFGADDSVFCVSLVRAAFYFLTVRGDRKSGAWRGSDSVPAGWPVPGGRGAQDPPRALAQLCSDPPPTAPLCRRVSESEPRVCPRRFVLSLPLLIHRLSAPLPGCAGSQCDGKPCPLRSPARAQPVQLRGRAVPQKTFGFRQSLPDGSSMVASYPVTSLSKCLPSQN